MQQSREPVPVFYFTNRKAKPMPDGEVSYENLIATDGAMSHGLSLAYAPTLTPAAGGPPLSNWWDIAERAVGNVPALAHLWELIHHNDDQARQQPNRQFELHNRPDTEDLPTFVKSLHAFAANSNRPKVLVFVHGFANSFEGAVDRMALLSQQYNFPGVPVVFSWASANTQLVDLNAVLSGDIMIGYVNDLRMVKRSCDVFQQMLEVLVSEFGSGNVMVLAHSMGSELVMDMLTACAGGNTWNGALKLGQLIFAAPDVDQGEFKKESTLVVTRAESTALMPPKTISL